MTTAKLIATVKAVVFHRPGHVEVNAVDHTKIQRPAGHRLSDAPHGYEIFYEKKHGCIKVLLKS